MEYPKKEKPTIKGAVNQILPFLKTDFIHLKNSYMDESACLWKQLKWNKFPFYGARLSGKIILGG